MMRRIILSFSIAFSAFLLQAQSVILTLSPNPVDANEIIDMNDPLFEVIGYATLTNVSNSPVSVRWTRVMPALPMGWEVLVCDNTSCYPPFVSSNILPEFDLNAPIELAPGASSNIDVHLRPNQLPGNTLVTIQFTSATDTTILATGTYNLSALLTSSVQNASMPDVRVFPNPVVDYFQLSSGSRVSRVLIYNTLGRQVRTYDAYDGRRYSLTGLPDGMYLVSLYDNAKGMIKTVRVIKRGFRP